MRENLSREEAETILKALDDALHDGPWDSSVFLRTIGKRLQGIRDDFARKMEGGARAEQHEKEALHHHQPKPGQRALYVSVYSATGEDMKTWEHILRNLPRNVMTRPIYEEEKDVQEMIKTRPNRMNEAYVLVYVHENYIFPLDVDRAPRDKLGKTLVTLKGGLQGEDIVRFFHASGTWRFLDTKLIRI